mmetsp:Transcript_11743/g.13293  ORF Transcript_11743/g.13293 Transcript_11743/m.13293 type:complete len:247 (-) Transcript_11743:234-974(-)
MGGGLYMANMLYRTNIIGMVGGGTNPKYPPNKLIIWDDIENTIVGELTFGPRIRTFALRRDIIAIAFEEQVMIFSLSDLELLKTHETGPNTFNVLSLNTKTRDPIVAMMGIERGQIKIYFIKTDKEVTIECHQGDIRAIALNPEGTLVATASTKGTLIRIFSTSQAAPVRELRRGSEKADIQSISFSSLSIYLACTSDKGTAHIFSIWADEQESEDFEPSIIENTDEELTQRRHSFVTRNDKGLQK